MRRTERSDLDDGWSADDCVPCERGQPPATNDGRRDHPLRASEPDTHARLMQLDCAATCFGLLASRSSRIPAREGPRRDCRTRAPQPPAWGRPGPCAPPRATPPACGISSGVEVNSYIQPLCQHAPTIQQGVPTRPAGYTGDGSRADSGIPPVREAAPLTTGV